MSGFRGTGYAFLVFGGLAFHSGFVEKIVLSCNAFFLIFLVVHGIVTGVQSFGPLVALKTQAAEPLKAAFAVKDKVSGILSVWVKGVRVSG